MKYQYLAVAATTFISTIAAFPKFTPDQLKTYQEESLKSAEAAGCPFAAAQKKEAEAESGCPFSKLKKRVSKFVAQEQLVDVTGEHEFVPPNFDLGDQRGPCPGLNALANHGYLPHNGVADMQTIVKATNEAYGMSLDLGGFLAIFGTGDYSKQNSLFKTNRYSLRREPLVHKPRLLDWWPDRCQPEHPQRRWHHWHP